MTLMTSTLPSSFPGSGVLGPMVPLLLRACAVCEKNRGKTICQASKQMFRKHLCFFAFFHFIVICKGIEIILRRMKNK